MIKVYYDVVARAQSLLNDMCDQVNKFGFVSLDKVMNLKCIKLFHDKEIPVRHVVGALRKSQFLTITKEYDSHCGPCHSSRLVGRS